MPSYSITVYEASNIRTPLPKYSSVIRTKWIIPKWNCVEKRWFQIYKKPKSIPFYISAGELYLRTSPIINNSSSTQQNTAHTGCCPHSDWGGFQDCPGTSVASSCCRGKPGHIPAHAAPVTLPLWWCLPASVMGLRNPAEYWRWAQQGECKLAVAHLLVHTYRHKMGLLRRASSRSPLL